MKVEMSFSRKITMSRMNARGFSLTELLIIMVIMSVLIALAAIPSKQWLDKYRAESELRTMHADLLQVRAKAMQNNIPYVVNVTKSTYEIYEDTNGDGMGGVGDKLLQTTQLRYPSTTSSTIYLGFDQRGIISSVTFSTDSDWPVQLFFDTASTSPEYDCFLLYYTRINIGKKDGGGKCVAR